jgi:hypothetical protein
MNYLTTSPALDGTTLRQTQQFPKKSMDALLFQLLCRPTEYEVQVHVLM